MESQEALFIRGVNNGYLLEQYEPTLLAKVLKGLGSTTDFVSGLQSGQKLYQQERANQELDELSKLREQGTERGRDHDL